MSSGIRRRARWYALQVLYALDVNPYQESQYALDSYNAEFALEVDLRSRPFAGQIVQAVVAHAPEIDLVIQQASRNWRLERMSRVDRNILRMATCELLHLHDAPVRVIINEAVELAKRFGASESPAFVNGILDRIAQGDRDDTDPAE
jgi:N utilization substance protein B